MIGIVSINLQAQKKISTNLVGGYKIETIVNIIKNINTYSIPSKSEFEKESNYVLKVNKLKSNSNYIKLFENTHTFNITLENFYYNFYPSNILYNAEKEIFITPNELHLYGDTLSYKIKCINIISNARSYKGSNAYGAKITVLSYNNTMGYISDDSKFYDKMKNLEILYDIKKANKLEKNISLLVTFTIDENISENIKIEKTYKEPTFDDPTDILYTDIYLPISIKQIDFYDKSTKKIIYTVK